MNTKKDEKKHFDWTLDHKPSSSLRTITNPRKSESYYENEIEELKHTIIDLQQQLEARDALIEELNTKAWIKRHENKSKKRKSKNDSEKLKNRVENIEQTVSTYERDWKFSKDMHKEDAKDTSKE